MMRRAANLIKIKSAIHHHRQPSPILEVTLKFQPGGSSKNSSLPVYSVASSASNSVRDLPTFLSAPTLIQVEVGKVALLECRVTHLAAHHTVSWLRFSVFMDIVSVVCHHPDGSITGAKMSLC